MIVGEYNALKVITVAARKGGSTRSTTSGHLAVAALEAGVERVAVMDLDEQASLSMWWSDRKAEMPALVDTRAHGGVTPAIEACRAAGIELVIIDTGPRVTVLESEAVSVADLVLIPVQPSIHDLRAVSMTVRMIEPTGKPFAFVLTRIKAGTKITSDARTALKQWGGALSDVTITDRIAFKTSMEDGLTVLETEPKGKSAEEVRALWAYVATKLEGKHVSRI